MCTNEPVKPEREDIEPLLDACFPDRPQRPESSEEDEDEEEEDEEESEEEEGEDSESGENTRPYRCSITPAMHIVSIFFYLCVNNFVALLKSKQQFLKIIQNHLKILKRIFIL